MTAAASTLPLFNINHAWSQDVVFDGEPFDAGGAELKLGEWGGFWEELRGAFINDFEKDTIVKYLTMVLGLGSLNL